MKDWRKLFVRFLFAALVPGLTALSGCHRDQAASDQRTPPRPEAPALYGPPIGSEATVIPRAESIAASNTSWTASPFYVLQTELSPATLVHCSTRQLDLFTGLTNSGLSSPAFVAWATINGPRTFKRGESLNVTNMAENWVLVWWAGAEGWTNWDSPWVVYLQHQPNTMKLDSDGLHLEFPRAAGDVVLLPLYGYDKLPQEGRDFRAEHGLPQPKVKVKTWEWPKVVTRDPLTRIRYWASATREFPIYCEDSFSVDRARDSVTIRSHFHWRSIDDDWKTRHVKLAPLSPPLAHAAKLGGFPVQFSGRWFDLEMPTSYGPYLAIEGADKFDATLSVLQYVNETEAFDPPAINAHPTVRLALEKLRAVATQSIQQIGTPGTGHETAGWLAKALPYFDRPTRSNAQAALRQCLQVASPRGYLNEFESLWAYAHVTGDWELARVRWPQVKGMLATRMPPRWSGFGSSASALGDQAAYSAAFARLAYQAGDMDAYNYGCYMFARQLTLLFLRQRGVDYFRQHQPWHSMEFMDEEVFLTILGVDNGWRMEGPNYRSGTDPALLEFRWTRFDDWDVARFYREYLREDARRELNWLQQRWQPARRWNNDPREVPSLVQLRSLLLNETPAELATVAMPDKFTGPPSGQIASCLSVLRTSHPTRYQRLIPPGEPSPFVTGVEREVSVPNTDLITSVGYHEIDPITKISERSWPRLNWPQWKTPAGDEWTFGHIRPVREGRPRAVRVVPLNWNTRVIVFDVP